ncbi:hypothetical protein [Nostoc sp. CHAB 5836]|nr:hypothetical protein [Nostoc sp. CHAB 5836]
MLKNVNRLKTLVNDEGQMTNDSLSQLALIAPTYLYAFIWWINFD